MSGRGITKGLGVTVVLALTGCASGPSSAVVNEVGDSFGRLRHSIAISVEPNGGLSPSFSPGVLLGNLRGSIARLPETFRLDASVLPGPSDVGRLLTPPGASWQPEGLGARVVSRFKF